MPEGFINWVCEGQSLKTELWTNDGMGQFTLVLSRSAGKGLSAPITYIQSVRVEERYRKLAIDNRISCVVFPAVQHGGSIVAEDLQAADLGRLAQTLISRNQDCK